MRAVPDLPSPRAHVHDGDHRSRQACTLCALDDLHPEVLIEGDVAGLCSSDGAAQAFEVVLLSEGVEAVHQLGGEAAAPEAWVDTQA